MAVVMSRVEESRPPAVSSSMIRAAAFCRSAAWMASSISSAETGWIADLTCTSHTWPAFGADEAKGVMRPMRARARSGRVRGRRRRMIFRVEYIRAVGWARPGGAGIHQPGVSTPGGGRGGLVPGLGWPADWTDRSDRTDRSDFAFGPDWPAVPPPPWG